jgi:hypothetical protein
MESPIAETTRPRTVLRREIINASFGSAAGGAAIRNDLYLLRPKLKAQRSLLQARKPHKCHTQAHKYATTINAPPGTKTQKGVALRHPFQKIHQTQLV